MKKQPIPCPHFKLFIAFHELHPRNPLRHDRCWVSLYALSSCCCFYLPSTPRTHTVQPEPHIHPLLYSKDNTLWTQSPTNRALDLNCTISIFHFFCPGKKYFSIPHLRFSSSIHVISFPIETLCFTLFVSCVNSSVSLIWDSCHLLSCSQAS